MREAPTLDRADGAFDGEHTMGKTLKQSRHDWVVLAVEKEKYSKDCYWVTIFDPAAEPMTKIIAAVPGNSPTLCLNRGRLIAAAPDLLAACKQSLRTFESYVKHTSGCIGPVGQEIDMLRAAIAKAEGGAA